MDNQNTELNQQNTSDTKAISKKIQTHFSAFSSLFITAGIIYILLALLPWPGEILLKNYDFSLGDEFIYHCLILIAELLKIILLVAFFWIRRTVKTSNQKVALAFYDVLGFAFFFYPIITKVISINYLRTSGSARHGDYMSISDWYNMLVNSHFANWTIVALTLTMGLYIIALLLNKGILRWCAVLVFGISMAAVTWRSLDNVLIINCIFALIILIIGICLKIVAGKQERKKRKSIGVYLGHRMIQQEGDQ